MPSALTRPHTPKHRGSAVPLATLSSLLKSHTEGQLYDRLRGLLDFLAVDEFVSNLLPADNDIPFAHVGVLGLQYYTMAAEAVDLALGSPAFSSDIGTWQQQRAFFYFAVHTTKGSTPSLYVYAVGGGWLEDLRSVEPVITTGPGATAVALEDAERVKFSDVVTCVSDYGKGLSAGDKALGSRIAAVLESRLSRMPVNGVTGSVKFCCVQAKPYGAHVPLWVVEW